jgi:hypothetical protein
MPRSYDYRPGIPGAGHLTGGGAWHPGAASSCGKPACQDTAPSQRRQPRARRCDERARKGTGEGRCEARLDRHGQCPDAGNHLDS